MKTFSDHKLRQKIKWVKYRLNVYLPRRQKLCTEWSAFPGVRQAYRTLCARQKYDSVSDLQPFPIHVDIFIIFLNVNLWRLVIPPPSVNVFVYYSCPLPRPLSATLLNPSRSLQLNGSERVLIQLFEFIAEMRSSTKRAFQKNFEFHCGIRGIVNRGTSNSSIIIIAMLLWYSSSRWSLILPTFVHYLICLLSESVFSISLMALVKNDD